MPLPRQARPHPEAPRWRLWLRCGERTVAGLGRLAAGLGALLILAMTAIVAYGVVMRYGFGDPQVWTGELAGYLLVLTTMLGAAEALRRGDHIGVDLLTSRLGARARRWAEGWGLLLIVFVAGALLGSGLDMVAFSRMVGLLSDGYLEVPLWIPQSSVLLGMVLLLLAALGRLLRLLAGEDGREAEGGA